MRFNTALLHGDFRGDKKTGATQTPVYQSSAFEQVQKLLRRYLTIKHLVFHIAE